MPRVGIVYEARGKARAESGVEVIDRRLAALAGRTDAEAAKERAYLLALRAKRIAKE